uniref:Putative transposase (Putative), gypsy type n=1 Tax=Helianthus annuus TaxID=4232 RepID=A0A251RMQ0_HELAN
MSTGEHQEGFTEEMSTELPPLKWSRASFDGLVQNFKFPESWGALFPEEGQTAADAPAGYITLFWDFFCDGNFRLPVKKFFLEILEFYNIHLSQLHPIGMVRVRHFEFVCRTMHIEPTVPRFRVFHQMHCTQGFYSFVQRASAKKILLHPPKSFHDWKQKFFFIKAGVIPVRMVLRGKEDVPVETLRTPSDETWYQDLKEIPNIILPERAHVGAGMSLNWKMDRDDKPVYTEGGHVVALYVVAYKREGGKMGTIKKNADEEFWYDRIVRNFSLPWDADLSEQPAAGVGELSNLGVGPEKKRRVMTSNVAPKKGDAEKTQSSKAKNVEKKGMRRSSDKCDYVVVSDTLEGLAPAVTIRRPKPEPKDSADIPPSNPEDPIDLESSPEHLVRRGANKRKQTDTDAEDQPPKKVQRKKITRRGNLDAFVTESVPAAPVVPTPINVQSVVNEELPPTPPHASAAATEGADDAEKSIETERSADAGLGKVDDTDNPSIPEVVTQDQGEGATEKVPTPSPSDTMPEHVERMTVEEQDSSAGVSKQSPIRPEETLGDYYYRSYSEKDAADLHAPVWNLKKGDTFADWHACQDWLQGIFPPGEVKFQESRSCEQAYQSYVAETASHVSTTHRIVREWYNMHKEQKSFMAAQKKFSNDEKRLAQLMAKLKDDQTKFEAERKTEEWSVAGWKRRAEAEAALLSEERKNWKKICEKDNAEKANLRIIINNLKADVEKLKNQDAEVERLKKEKADLEAALAEARSHREQSEQREVQALSTLAIRDKELEELTALVSDQEQLKKDLELARSEYTETSRRLTEVEEKLENSETARVTVESELDPLKSDMAWLKDRGIACVAESVLNSKELDKTVAELVVAARRDGYAQGYAECSYHVNDALKVNWDDSKSAAFGVDTAAALASLKAEFNNLQLPVMELINVALQSDDPVTQLKEIFPDEDEDLE